MRRTGRSRLAWWTLLPLLDVVSVTALLCIPAGHAAGQDVLVGASAAWAGHFRPGHTTEIALRLRSRQGGHVSVHIDGLAVPTTIEVELDAGASRTVRVTGIPSLLDPLTIDVHQADHPAGQRSLPLLAMTTSVPTIAKPVGVELEPLRAGPHHTMAVQAGDLPHSFAAYATIDVLVIDDAILRRLDGVQLAALRAYIHDCGRLITIGLPASAVAYGSPPPWCPDGTLDKVDSPQAAQASATRLLSAPIPLRQHGLPPGLDLDALLSRLAPRQLPVGVWSFLTLYLLALIMAASLRLRFAQAFSIPVLAVGVALAVWSQRPATQQTVLWLAKIDEAMPPILYGLRRFIGNGPAIETIRLDAGGEFLSTPPQDASLVLDLPIGQPRTVQTLSFKTHLGSRHEASFRKALRSPAPWELVSQSGGIVVVNRSADRTPRASLIWHDHGYDIPRLDIGQRWSPRVADEPSALSRLAESLKLPLEIPIIVVPAASLPPFWQELLDQPAHTSWLFIAYPVTEQGLLPLAPHPGEAR